ncbi:MAG: serine/threonine protein kinase [Mariniblastus sp.]|nr:serine/threonine protein kinase [Mariniblastus sp.]
MSSERPSFRESAITSGLVTEEHLRLAAMQVSHPDAHGKTATQFTDKKLATQLIKMKVLTAYQADQLMTGRTKLNLGPYIITGWIGQGGMGQVFKGTHEMLGRDSAVKVLPLHKTTPDAIANFRREIRAQAKLDHPNLVRAYDAGEDGNVHYLVVEYVPGTDLRRLVRTKGKLSVQQAANIVKQSAEGLHHAHLRNLIHRDIKPGNILVTADGVAKLSDLGLAFYLNDPNDPRVGKIVGTADYLSPEQIKTPLDVTIVSDIYSLGCTLYYAITGKVPFPGGTPKSKARRHLEETPWHPRRFNEEVSDEFVDLIGDMMEKDPAERIQTAAEVAERLAPWASDDSPLLSEDMERSRWMPAPVADNQDTDPNDVAEMAMSELSGSNVGPSPDGEYDMAGETGSFSNTSELSPALPQGTISGQYMQAPRLPKDGPRVSIQLLFLITVSSLALGVLIGFICGYLMSR